MPEKEIARLEDLPEKVNPDGPILVVGMVRNEADIIEATIRHNLAYADHIHFVDDSSSDGTDRILQALAGETGQVSFERHDDLGFAKGKLLRRIATREGRQRSAGHIVLLDADEALTGEPEAFRHLALHSRIPLVLPWTTYVPTPEDLGDPNPLVRIRNCRSQETPQRIKLTIPHGLTGKVWFDNGFHYMRSGGKDLQADRDHPFRIAHFPIRSAEQLVAKVLIGTWNYRLNPDREPSNGSHWRKMVDDVLANGLPGPERLRDLALGYAAGREAGLVMAPLHLRCDPALRYTSDGKGDLALKIMAFTEQLVSLLEGVTSKDKAGS
jgi:glycosyltransferase involved in cell wall biosynthesis